MTWARRLAIVQLVVAGAAGVLVFGAVLGAFAASSPQGIDTSSRFEFLARAASPVPAALALAAVLLAAWPRAESAGDRDPLVKVAVGIAAFFSVVMILLGINGILLDLTTGSATATALTRLSRILFLRLGPIGLAVATVWLSLDLSGAPSPQPSGGGDEDKGATEPAPPDIPPDEET